MPERRDTCDWSNADDDTWATDCGEVHCFLDGGIVENRYVWCPYCGGLISESAGEAEEW